jgi:1-acyl-sn-glycerol-3-phosphate acyltransferase
VIPVNIQGTFEALPRDATCPRPASIRVRFGEPIGPEEWDALDRLSHKARLRHVTERVMAAIRRLQP